MRPHGQSDPPRGGSRVRVISGRRDHHTVPTRIVKKVPASALAARWSGTPVTTMRDFRQIVIEELSLYLDRLERALARLDDRSAWVRPTAGVNSVGNLVLHLDGNIRLYVGQGVGGISYERDRRAEFEARGGDTVDQLRSRTASLRTLVQEVVCAAADETLDTPSDLEDYGSKREQLLHVVAHAGYHTGQAVLLSKLLSGDDTQLLDWGH